MRWNRTIKAIVVVAVLVTLTVLPTFEASAGGRFEFGVALPVSTSFGFSSFGFALEAYARILGAMFIWETALHTYTAFNALSIRNTIATASALFLSFGHVTSLLPSFGSTYLTGGVGLTLGRMLATHLGLNLAVSIGGGSFYPFLELRIQFGIDP